MPIYEYVCRDCRTSFEKLVRRFGEDVACPGCAGGSVDRQLSVFAVSTSGGRSAASSDPFAACGRGACGDPTAGCGTGDGGGACGLPS